MKRNKEVFKKVIKTFVMLCLFLAMCTAVVKLNIYSKYRNFTYQDLENIKTIIMSDRQTTKLERKIYDVNNDGLITAIDYVKIKNKISK